MSHPAIDFYLREFDLSANATLATIDGGEITLYPSFDDKIEFDMSLSLAQTFFRFISDGHDISDNTDDDILFHHVDVFDVLKPFGPNFMVRNKCISTMCHTDELYKSLPDNYLRDGLSQYLFNTWKGVDLFNNEYDVREHLRSSILNRMENIKNALCTRDANNPLPSMAITLDNPSRTILRHILKSEPSRLTPLHRVPTAETLQKILDLSSVEFYMPLQAGDSLAFLVEVIADVDQSGIIDTPLGGAITIPNRKFLVVSNLVGDNYWDLDAYKTAIVAEFQTARTLAASAKSAMETAYTALTAANTAVGSAQTNYDAPNGHTLANENTLSGANAAKVAASDDYNEKRSDYERLRTLANGLWNECQPARSTDDVSRTSYQ
jgi:hypothetical protein